MYLKMVRSDTNRVSGLWAEPTRDKRFSAKPTYVKFATEIKKCSKNSLSIMWKYWAIIDVRIEEQNIPKGCWHLFISEMTWSMLITIFEHEYIFIYEYCLVLNNSSWFLCWLFLTVLNNTYNTIELEIIANMHATGVNTNQNNKKYNYDLKLQTN